MDYQTHQNKFIPVLAECFACTFAHSEVSDTYNKMINNIEKKQDFSLLGPMHIIISGMKALWMNNCYEGVKVVREACGAAGWTNQSGIPQILDTMSSYVTLEGDFIVMMLQTAKAVLKTGKKVLVKGKDLNKHIEYLQDLSTLRKDPTSMICKANSIEEIKTE